MNLDFVISFVIFLIALSGIGVTARMLRLSTHALRVLDRTPGTDQGVRIITTSHIRSDMIRLYIHAVFIVTGLIQLIPHQRYDVYWWFGLAAVVTMQLLLIYGSLAARKDQTKAALFYVLKP